jgi:hypothetical protein
VSEQQAVMSGQWSKAIQYLYFIRFSLLLWLFPVIFAALDSGVLPFSSTTLSRGIFVPEELPGFLCVAFFTIATGCVALITARAVMLNGIERFAPADAKCVNNFLESSVECARESEKSKDAPQWMIDLFRNDGANFEARAVVLALIPTALMFVYVYFCATFEKIAGWQAIAGLAVGTGMAALFWYFVNAWYYLAYERPCDVAPNSKLELGKNAARTILLPRRCFRLRMPQKDTALPSNGHVTLEDIQTSLRTNWISKKARKLADWARQRWGLPGYFYKDGQPYEAHLFSFIAAIGFLALFWVLCPLTAPVFSRWSLVALVVLFGIGILLISVVWSAKGDQANTCHHKTASTFNECDECRGNLSARVHKWKVSLTAMLGGFCVLVVIVWANSFSERFPTLAAVLLLMTLLAWGSAALAFFCDRFRVPVLTGLLLVAVLPRVFHVYDWNLKSLGPFEEHYVSTVPLNGGDALPTPAEILDAHLNKIHDGHPLIIVTSTGGGLHASAWTARVLRELYREMTEKNQDPKSLTGHILVMSTVSGGSVGLKYYLEAIHANPEKPNFDAMVVAAQCSSLEAVGWGLIYYDFTKASAPLGPFFMWPSEGDGNLDRSPLWKDRTWALRKAFERNENDPYCYTAAKTYDPTPADIDGESPGRRPWYKRWSPPDNASRLTIGHLQATETFPAFTMNTTTAEGGERLLLANYRLPGYPDGPVEGSPAESFISVFDPSNRPDLPLSSAAQMSATFPYVSSAVRVPAKYTWYSEHFVDGGYYDNDGTSSAIEFLRYALDTPTEATTDADEKNKTAVTDVRGLGPVKILLIEIRNSADSDVRTSSSDPRLITTGKPDPATFYSHTGLLQQLGLPLDGFWSAGHESVTGRNRNGLDLLLKSEAGMLQIHQVIFDDQRKYPTKGQADPDKPWYIHSAADPLSWSLTPKERAEVTSSSNRNGWLRTCYEDAAAWYANFDNQYQQHAGETTKRCKRN